MLQQAPDVVAPHVGEAGVAELRSKQRLTTAPQRAVHVHARTVVSVKRLRHKGGGETVRTRNALDYVLVQHQLVRHREQRVETHVDLGLTGCADFVVLHLDLDPHLLHREDHLRTEVLEMVHRRDREIAFLVARLEAEVGPVGAASVPDAFDGVDVVVPLVGVLVEADVIENEELGLGPEIGRVGYSGRDQVVLRLLGNIAGIARVRLPRDGVAHEGVDVQGLVLAERVQDSCVRVGHEEHVRLLDLLEAADRRAVEAEAILEGALGQLVSRN